MKGLYKKNIKNIIINSHGTLKSFQMTEFDTLFTMWAFPFE